MQIFPAIKSSLRKDYLMFSGILVSVTLALCLAVFAAAYHEQKEEERFYYGHYAEFVDHSLTQILDSVAFSVRAVGERIVEDGNSKQDIARILTEYASTLRPRNFLSWTMYDWIPPDNRITINSAEGVLEHPIPSNRTHLQKTAQSPGRIFFSDVDIGLTSKQRVIPAGMGIKNRSNQFIGTVNIGVTIEELTDQIEQNLENTIMSFAIINRETWNLAVESAQEPEEENIQSFAALEQDMRSNTGFLSTPIRLGSVEYRYFQNVEKYPFVILLGINPQLAQQKLINRVLPRVLEMVLLMFFMLALLYYFRRRIVRPVAKLAEVATKMVHEPGVLIPRDGYEEINVLSDRLREIQLAGKQLIELRTQESKAREEAEKAREELRSFNNELEKRVSQRTADLERSLQIKTEFLNNLSHELRTPVHGVCSYLETLVDHWQDFPENERKNLIENIFENSQRLYALINELLDLAKFSANKMTYQFESHDFFDVVEEAEKESKALIGKKELTLYLTREAQAYSTSAQMDRSKIHRVLINLYANAIKFTPKGSIYAHVYETEIRRNGMMVPALAFSLKDEGVGIAAEEIDEIFMPFSQGRYTKSGSGGTGLGLSICKEIIQGHGGRISVESKGLGKGSTFTMVIPLENVSRGE